MKSLVYDNRLKKKKAGADKKIRDIYKIYELNFQQKSRGLTQDTV